MKHHLSKKRLNIICRKNRDGSLSHPLSDIPVCIIKHSNLKIIGRQPNNIIKPMILRLSNSLQNIDLINIETTKFII
ncbi:hypothetical protein DERF_006718 [Dermatophagoides farinae]|uniref:Uncharacterized protein n=1 Tax=Dermatophagoides farinae TaxID=6954 RepID=A0A922HZ00_DERFA|nr:hypothetical protein DERF_006718 [Dermatophagoides farinae]